MNRNTQTIEQIVAEVVRRLSQLAEASPATSAAAGAAPKSPSPPPAPPKPVAGSDTLVLDAHVITTATIHGRLKGIRRVVVEHHAVVTPSVKDVLRKQNIRLEHQEATLPGSNSSDLTVVRFTRGDDATRATATLPLPVDAAEQLPCELPAAVAAAAQAVESTDRISILVTDESLAAACLLNRSSHVRAARVRSAEETKQAIRAIGANVVVIDPRDVTANQWNAVVKVFGQDLPRGVPVW